MSSPMNVDRTQPGGSRPVWPPRRVAVWIAPVVLAAGVVSTARTAAPWVSLVLLVAGVVLAVASRPRTRVEHAVRTATLVVAALLTLVLVVGTIAWVAAGTG